MTTERELPGVRFSGDSAGDGHYPIQSAEQRLIETIRDFNDPHREWRRLSRQGLTCPGHGLTDQAARPA